MEARMVVSSATFPPSIVRPSGYFQNPPIWHSNYVQSITKKLVIVNCSNPSGARMAVNSTTDEINSVRKCGYSKYPPIWHLDYVQSITNEFGEKEVDAINNLKDKVRMTLNEEIRDPLVQLEHIDMLQRLGLSYHFEDEIDNILNAIYNSNDFGTGNLYAVALKFRLLRQHRYWVPQEVFNNFKDEMGNFKACLGNDVTGLLSLYEASFLSRRGEIILDEARDFTTKHLQEFVRHKELDENNYLSMLVGHALHVPLHWRVPRVEARWFIDTYKRKEDVDPTFIELAVLDFNVVQSVHLEEVKQLYRWWTDIGLAKKMKFSRDRLVENALWNAGVLFEPQYGYLRKTVTKLFMLMSIVDDIYDTYGALDDLYLLTKAFKSWDMDAMDALPEYMKICFLAVYNFINELAFDVLREQGFHVIKYLKKAWTDVVESYLVEAKWYHSGTTPPFQEYIENAWISITVVMTYLVGYLCVTNPIREEALEFLLENSSIIRESSLIQRLANDLVTSTFESKKGDVPTSINCYMHEFGASEDEARQHIKFLINEAWKQTNEDQAAKSPFSQKFIELIINGNRMTMWIYDGRDGYGVENLCETKNCASSFFFEPIPSESYDQND